MDIMDKKEIFYNSLNSIRNLGKLGSAIYHQRFRANINKKCADKVILEAQEVILKFVEDYLLKD